MVKDLIAARLESGAPLYFEVDGVAVEPGTPRVGFTHDGARHELDCDLIAGCDGFHGVCRPSIAAGVLRTYEREYPYGWLGILAAVAPSNDELVYAHHERGFALLSLRSPSSRGCISSVAPTRISPGGPTTGSGRSYRPVSSSTAGPFTRGPSWRGASPGCGASSPSHAARVSLPRGRCSPHRPADGGQGAEPRDPGREVLAEAIVRWYQSGDRSGLDGYSEACLRRVWRAEHFSYWMTTMLHRDDEAGDFGRQLQLSQLRYVTSSEAAAASLAENYVGLDAV